MTHRERIKRQLVHAVVRENLDTIRGRLPGPLRRGRRLRNAAWKGYRLVIGPALLFVAISLLATGGSESRGLLPRPVSLEGLAARLASSTPRAVDAAAFPLGVKRIVLDPGHGGADPGAAGVSNLLEKDIALDVARRLRILLRESAFEVVMTREHDEMVSLRERALFANASRGDLFVSIHVNAILTREQCGIETYHLGPTEDPQAAELAGWENRESGYSLTDFRRLLQGLYVHVREEESRQFANVVQRGLVTFLGRTIPAIKDNGVKTAPFLVLVATEMPGILSEMSCLSNDEQAQLLASPGYRQNVARGLFVGIRAYADARNRLGRRGSL
ncbi:MAG: N-acetylmuramoyl-L-alanine amidase family protein [Candidatus Rokuibacteriota bacterium]